MRNDNVVPAEHDEFGQGRHEGLIHGMPACHTHARCRTGAANNNRYGNERADNRITAGDRYIRIGIRNAATWDGREGRIRHAPQKKKLCPSMIVDHWVFEQDP